MIHIDPPLAEDLQGHHIQDRNSQQIDCMGRTYDIDPLLHRNLMDRRIFEKLLIN